MLAKGRPRKFHPDVNDPKLRRRLEKKRYYQKYQKTLRAFQVQYRADHRDGLVEYHRKYRRENPQKCLWRSAKYRARKANIPFTLELKDIPPIPKFCPIFPWIRIELGSKRFGPSLDRIQPKLGYVLGNIRVISLRANMLRSNGTIPEFEAILADAKRRVNRLARRSQWEFASV